MFEVVAVNPTNGTQLAKSNARNHASDIFQEMVSMGVGADKIALTARSSAEATSSEVQIYVK